MSYLKAKLWALKTKIPNKAKTKFVQWAQLKIPDLPDINEAKHHIKSSELYQEAGHALLDWWPECKILFGKLAQPNSKSLLLEINNTSFEGSASSENERTKLNQLFIIAIANLMDTRVRVKPEENFPFNTAFHTVTPRIGHEKDEAVNYGAGNFPYHNDRIYVSDHADFHVLKGIKSPAGRTVQTSYRTSISLIEKLPLDTRKPLFEKNFQNPKDENQFIAAYHGDPKHLTNIWSTIDLSKGWMIAVNTEAKDALDKLKSISHQQDGETHDVNIEPGVVIISNAKKLVHGRKAFSPGPKEKRRELLRAHLVLNH